MTFFFHKDEPVIPIGGIVGSPGRTAYSASKHAIIGLTQSAAFEYANKGIVINAVCPGMVDTPMTKRMTNNYDPEIVKRMISRAPMEDSDVLKRSLQPLYGFVVPERALRLVT